MREPYLSPCDDPLYRWEQGEENEELDEYAELNNIFDDELYPDEEEAI